jgi:hypothetical protein
VSGSSGGGELGSVWDSAEMINDGCSDSDRQLLIKSLGEDLLPTS